ncbi:MAG: type IV pilus modification PilV family protein, partial [Acidimicrobiales bacterium]
MAARAATGVVRILVSCWRPPAGGTGSAMAARWGAGTIVYRRARWPAGRRSGERGFTLVEVLIAITLMLGTLLGLAYISTNGLVDVGLARQRQGATGLANEAIEKMRTLPFDTLARGLDAADAAADPRIVACGTNLCSNGEIVPTFSAGATTVDPIVPHVTPGIVVGPTTYTVSAYVTRYADPDGTTRPNVYRGRVVASWANSLRGGIAPEVVVESVFHSPAGCQSTATHPFAAPCEPFFYASASSDAASIRIEPVAGGWGTLRDAALELTQHSSAMQVEQVHSVQGSARLPAVSMRYTDGSPDDLLIAGAGVAPTASSNDPTLGLPPYSASTLNLSSLGALVSNGPNSVAVNSAGGHASSVSTIAANGAQPCQGQTDDRPCGTAHGHQDGILSATVLLADGRVALAA